MRSLNTYLLLGVLVLTYLSSCSSVRVVDSRENENADFQKFETYEFLDVKFEDERKYVLSDKVIKEIKKNVDSQMQARGYSKSADPDLYVNIGITIETKQTTRETDYRDAQTGYIGQRNYHWEAQEVVVNEYEEGTVVVEVVDSSNESLVWICAVAGTVKGKSDKMAERVEEAITKAYTKYPVPATNP